MTSDEWLEEFKINTIQFHTDISNLTLQEARDRYNKLFENQPAELLINPFGLEKRFRECFGNSEEWKKGEETITGRKIFKINIEDIKNENVEEYINKLTEKYKND